MASRNVYEVDPEEVDQARQFMADNFPKIAVGPISAQNRLTPYDPESLQVRPVHGAPVTTRLIVAPGVDTEIRHDRVAYTINGQSEVLRLITSPVSFRLIPFDHRPDAAAVTITSEQGQTRTYGNIFVQSTGTPAENVYPVRADQFYGFVGFGAQSQPQGVFFSGAVIVHPVTNK